MERFKTVFGIDLRTLALFRVALALVLLADLINRATNLVAHYTDDGVLRRADAIAYLSQWRLSIHLWNGTAFFEGVLFALAGLAALALLAGWRTRVAAVVSWFLLLSLQNRNPLILQGGDNLLLMLLFWSMFLPLGARWSVDAALSQVQVADNRYFSMATLALLIQVMSVYFFSALLKTGNDWLADGTAVYYALHLDSLATPFAVWFRGVAPPVVLSGLTYFVWYLEFVGPILMFSPVLHVPLRLVLLGLFIAMHLGFWLNLEIGLFPFISIASLLVFTPGAVWDRLGARLRTRERRGLWIYYDQDCEFCRKVCLLLRTFLILPDTLIVPAQNEPEIHDILQEYDSWVVVDHDETRYVRWRAVAIVFLRSPIFWPLGFLFAARPFQRLGRAIYGWIAAHRPVLGRVSAWALPFRDIGVAPSRLGTGLVSAALAIVIYGNLASLPDLSWPRPAAYRMVYEVLRFDQKWNMFAPNPAKVDGWLVVRGELADGTIVDAYRGRLEPPSFRRPRYVSQVFGDYRWRKYFSRLWFGNSRQLLNYGRYICRSWNRRAAPSKRLMHHQIYFNRERTLPEGRGNEFERILIWRHDCFKPG